MFSLDMLRPTLAAGLCWLYDTEQPSDATIQHHGAGLPSVANRRLRFCPQGWEGHPVVVIDVAHVEWDGPYLPAKNPLAAGELDAVATLIAETASPVVGIWNGHPAITGSVALSRPAHPTLVGAVNRYRAGCPEHSTVFCTSEGCTWYRAGHAKIIHPISPRPVQGLSFSACRRAENTI
jgi:hypothetical protein